MVLGMSAFVAGGNDAEAAPEDDISATLDAVVNAWNAGDVDTFITYWTDEGLADQFPIEQGQTQKEAIEAVLEENGKITSHELSDIFATSTSAHAIVDLQFEAGFNLYEKWEFHYQDGMWKIGAGESASRPIPEGVPAVDLDLQEYAFNYNAAAIQAADGNFAFKVQNVGAENHEVLVVKIDSDQSLLDLLQNSDPESEDLPEGVEFVQFGGEFTPGSEGTVIFQQPLDSGRYGLVCFLSSPQGVPHAFLGMISEFNVGQAAPVATSTPSTGGSGTPPSSGGSGGGVVTPPNTGDGGLLNHNGGSTTALMLGISAMLMLGGTAGLVKSRVSARK
jgi:hypothetical protein